MKNEERIAELLAGALIKFDQMVTEQRKTNDRLDHVEESLNKLNLQTAENTRAIFKLAEKTD